MALAPNFAGQRLLLSSNPSTKPLHTVEIYLDYVCPFSAKMFHTLYNSVFPAAPSKPYASTTQFLFRQQIQPWHPSSTLVHEAALAVLSLAPDTFWKFSEKLFARQTEYFDVNVVEEGRNETYKRLAKLGNEAAGVEEQKMYDLLKVANKPAEDGSLNIGNAMTNDLKTQIKMARLVGVHVSPTVVFNGIVENSISSSFTADQWHEWLEKNCT